jgi:hypothetical protein
MGINFRVEMGKWLDFKEIIEFLSAGLNFGCLMTLGQDLDLFSTLNESNSQLRKSSVEVQSTYLNYFNFNFADYSYHIQHQQIILVP